MLTANHQDEILPIYVVLKSSYQNENELRKRIQRLAITVEAHAVSSPSISTPTGDRPTSSGSTARDIIWSGKVEVSEDPITVVASSAEEDEGQDVLLIWKLFATLGTAIDRSAEASLMHIGRPRVRLQAPAIIFKVSASLNPPRTTKHSAEDLYLPEGVPLPSNILEPLEKDPTFHGAVPRLSTMRLSRNSGNEDSVRQQTLPIKVVSRKPFRAIPALSSRVRFHRPSFNIGNPSLLAALEFDIPAFAQRPIEIVSATLNLGNGVIKSLGEGGTQELPIVCHARDSIVRLYRISPSVSIPGTPSTNSPHSLEVAVRLRVAISDLCRPNVEIKFKASVDFSTSNIAHATKTRSLERANKPTSILPTPNNVSSSLQSSNLNLDSENASGIVLQFKGAEKVFVGKPFKWEVFVMNRSSRQKRLGFTMLSRKKTVGEKRISSRPTSNSNSANKTESVASPFVDDNLLYTMMRSHALDSPQIVSLDSDLQVG